VLNEKLDRIGTLLGEASSSSIPPVDDSFQSLDAVLQAVGSSARRSCA